MFVCLAEVEAEESASLKQLQALISIACEYLGLWKILCDHQFHVIAGALSPVSLAQQAVVTCLIIICLTLYGVLVHFCQLHSGSPHFLESP